MSEIEHQSCHLDSPKLDRRYQNPKTFLRDLLIVGVSLTALYYILVLVSALYLGHISVDAALSFWSNDFPRPMPASSYPIAFGNHFFGDFLVPFRLAQQPSPYLAPGYIPFGYLPLAAVLLGPLTILPYWWAFVVFLTVSLTILLRSITRCLPTSDFPSRGLLITVLVLSGPFVNAIDRGNVGLLLVSLLCLGVSAEFTSTRHGSAVLFGLAAAMKLYPAVLGAFFLRKRRWKALGIMTLTFALCTVAPASLYDEGLKRNTSAVWDQFVGSSNFEHANRINAFNNSFFAFFRALSLSGVSMFHSVGELLVRNYYPVVVAILCISLWLGLSSRLSDFSYLCTTCVTMVFLPNIVAAYVLLVMFAPLLYGLTAVSRSQENLNSWDAMRLALLVLLLVPKGLPFPNPLAIWSQSAATYSSVLNPLLGMAILAVSVVEFGFGSTVGRLSYRRGSRHSQKAEHSFTSL